MKKLFILSILFILQMPLAANAQSFSYNWAHNMGMLGPGYVAINGSCTDVQNHYYTVGKMDGTVDTEPTINYNYINGGNTGTGSNGFFAEYDSSGALVRSKVIGGLTVRTWLNAIAIDSNGDIIIAGAFRDSTFLEPNNPLNITYQTGTNLAGESFLIKYDSSFNLIWLKTFDNLTILNLEKIEIDSQNNIFVSGIFDFTMDIDPSASVFNLSTYDAGTFYKDVFLAKFNSNGTLNWAKNMGSQENDNLGDISLDPAGNIYIGNTYDGTNVLIDSSEYANSVNGDFICITKFSNSGQYIWNKEISASSSTIELNDLSVNSLGEVFFTGKMYGSFYFQFPSIYRGSGSSTTCDYFAKLNVNGDCVWANSGYGDPSTGYSIALDDLSRVYLAGTFSGTKDFDYGVGIANVSSSPANALNYYLAAYDSSGSYRWASKLSTTGGNPNPDIRISSNQKFWMEGDFNGTADFDPGATANNITVPVITNFVTTYSSNGGYQSAFAFKGCGSTKERVTSVDASVLGSVVTAGMFTGDMDFDLSLNNVVLSSSTDSNSYIVSYSNTGAFNWVNQIKGKALITSIARNTDGDIYVTGYYTGVTYFDLNTPSFYLSTTSANIDIFMGKYNSNGVLQWMNKFSSTNTDKGYDITIDNNGNVIMAGIFATLIDFDPSPTGIFELTTPQNSINGYVAKYDANGNFITAFKVVGSICNNVCTDNYNNIIVNGTFHGFGNFNVVGGNAIVYATGGSQDDDYFIAKYDSLGIYQWAFRIGSEGANYYGSDIAVDNAGNINFVGYFYSFADTVDVDPTIGVSPVLGSAGIVAKYNSAGNLIFGFSSGIGRSPFIAIDTNGNSTITSKYVIPYDLDPGPNDATLTVPNWSTLVVRYSSVGQYLGAQTYSAFHSIYPGCIAISAANEVYIGGIFNGNVDLNLSQPNQNLIINSGTNANPNGFLVSLNQPDYLAQVPPSASFTSNSTNFCEGVCINFQDNSLYAPNNWNWSFPGANPASSTSQNPQNICYSTAGTYTVQLIVSNPLGADTLIMNNYIIVDAIPQTNAGADITVCEGSSLQLNGSGANNYSWSPSATLVNPNNSNPIASPINTTIYTLTGTNGSCSTTDDITITVNPNPATPTITPVGGELQSSSAAAYQWYYNGSAISGATLQNIFPTQIGNYSVTVFDSSGCFASSSSYLVTVVGVDANHNVSSNFVIAPNPVTNEIYINSTQLQNNLNVRLYDISGKLIASKSMQFNEGLNKIDFEISQLNAGVYRVEIDNQDKIISLKMVKLND